MIRLTALLAALLWTLPHLPAVAADGAPAGYVVDVALAGEDAERKTAIARGGQELPPKLMMPVFEGDAVFLRSPESRIRLELGDGEVVDIGGDLLRYDVKGEIDTGDDTWSILTAIGGILGGTGDVSAPDNMVSRGDDGALAAPMARRGGSYVLKGTSQVWLGWTGGEAPFRVSLGKDGVPSEVKERSISLPLDGQQDRINLVIRDARDHRVDVWLRRTDTLPALPADLAARPDSIGKRLAIAAWLTSVDDGSWSIAAAQDLAAGMQPAERALLDQLRQGWRFTPASP